ncbi:hypothetical protein CIHG_05983 [Coccidioides immitis H538.4]|uniref:Glutathione S-transferase n=1 Tax=Coccidioides immitis H538.4 TaxID=396776 RepID=A0A0J8RR24_COCIT|nr:hypothetical protein CIHG_05983 [Coccidioides immitis H538.4]
MPGILSCLPENHNFGRIADCGQTMCVNRHIIPCFYRLLQEQDFQKQIEYTEELKDDISKLVNASHVTGPFFLGPDISFVDIQFAPWMLRLSRVLKPYRGWPDPEKGSRWAAWVDAIEANDQIMATTSSDELYLDSYQRYAGTYFKFPLHQGGGPRSDV